MEVLKLNIMKTSYVIRLIDQFTSTPCFIYFIRTFFRCRAWLAMPVVLLLVMGCGENDDPCSDSLDYTNVLQERLNALTEASEAYANDPTPANCQQYKNSFRAYWKANIDLSDCASKIVSLPFTAILSEKELEQEIATLCP